MTCRKLGYQSRLKVKALSLPQGRNSAGQTAWFLILSYLIHFSLESVPSEHTTEAEKGVSQPMAGEVTQELGLEISLRL